MAVEYCVVSIGTLSQNRLWGESTPVRTAHATMTLISEGDRQILVDPSLPATVLAARLNERTGLSLSAVTDVFCTTLRPPHRRGVQALPEAQWWCSGEELETHCAELQELLDSADRLDAEVAAEAEADLELLRQFRPAPEQFTPQVQLYPMFGASAGSAGLLLTPPTMTVVVAGDAALTAGHVERGQIYHRSSDTRQALQSLSELVELADVIVPGHDNVMLSPGRSWL